MCSQENHAAASWRKDVHRQQQLCPLPGPCQAHFLLPFLPALLSSLSAPPSLDLPDAIDCGFYCLPTYTPSHLPLTFFSGALPVSAYSSVPLFMTQVPEGWSGSDRVWQRLVRVWASSGPPTSLQLGSSRRPFSWDSEPQHMRCRSRTHAEGVTSGFETMIFLFLF